MRQRTGGPARLTLVAALTALACTVPATAAHAAATSTDAAGSADADTVVALVNEERDEAGCSPVTAESHLTAAAAGHSRDQADMGKMTHTGSDGSSSGERAKQAGYQWRTIGENVASGTSSPQRAMQLWMNSEGHRDNILNCKFVHIGVAEVDGYWTQVFAAPK